MLELNSENAHTFRNWSKLVEELEIDVVYHYMLMSYRALYGKTVTVQWHFGNGPDIQLTSFQMDCEGLRRGDVPASVYLNVRIARVYMKHVDTLVGRGGPFAVAGDVREASSPAGGHRRVG